MRRRLPRIVLILAVWTLLLVASASAQTQARAPRPASSPLWALPVSAPGARAIRIEASDQPAHTVLGLMVGAGLGFAAGLGALIGSAAD